MEHKSCFHCGLDCKSSPITYDNKSFCCNGCKTVYEIFTANDLTCYYDLQNAPGATPTEIEGKYDFLNNPSIVEKLLEFDELDLSFDETYFRDVAKIAKSKTDEELRGLIIDWQTVDYVPKDKVAKADSSFNDSIKKAAKTLKIDDDALAKLRFEAKIFAIKSGENPEVKMKTERNFINTQIEKVQEELIRFEENMSFFGPSKGAQKLKEVVEKRVAEGKDKIGEWKDQLKMLR